MNSEPLLIGNSIVELRSLIQKMPLPQDAVQATEFATLLSLSYSPLFSELFVSDGAVSVRRGDEPPDFVAGSPGGETSVEITRFTVPQTEIFHRERRGPGLYTSTLRSSKPNNKFWSDLKGRTLPDDSDIEPHVEAQSDLDADYFKAAETVLKEKYADLVRYGEAYKRRVLLVHDKLTEFKSEFERRLPALSEFTAKLPEPRFDVVAVVDGNHYSGVFSARL